MEGGLNLSLLEKKLGIEFIDKNLLIKALTHKSYAFENEEESNERLEFLGDSILNSIVSGFLFINFPEMEEGEMSKLRARLIGTETLYKIGKKMRIGEFLLLGKGEEKTAGREKKRIIVSAVEALIAALYLDRGYESTKDLVIKWIKPVLGGKSLRISTDYKSILQELVQKKKMGLPEYRIVKESGPPHNKIFKIELWVEGRKISSSHGKSKKEAQQKAAKIALKTFSEAVK
ncbi:MAG: ribonuclease III [Candidatus Aminicenantia bacterium]